MYFGYNTNGFAHHPLELAIEIIAAMGYRGVAITLDYHALNPYDAVLPQQLRNVRGLIEKYQLQCVIETGTRFLLDPYRKHQPTLLSASADDRSRRVDFLSRSMTIARELGASCISFWSGTAIDGAAPGTLMDRLVEGIKPLLDAAEKYQIPLAFEPEPGMFVDRMERYAELHARINHPLFGMTLDIGHLQCEGELPISKAIEEWRTSIRNIHIEDMKRGVHDHLPFGQGEIDFADVFAALTRVQYGHGLYVELSRHSHDAVRTATESLGFLSDRA